LVVRIGLGYVKGVHIEEMESLVRDRDRDGSYRGIADLASRSGASRDGLERLAWAGGLDPLVGAEAPGRRGALWETGVMGTGVRHEAGTQMALPLETPGAPRLEPLGDWEKAIADYRSIGMTLGDHPMTLMRSGLGPELLRSSDLERAEDGRTVEVAGMVVARQRPETAKGVVFMLLEDERGTVNLIVPPPVYERHRALARTAPLVRARGKLERREGTTNVLVYELAALEHAGVPAQGAPGEEESAPRPGRPTRRPGPATGEASKRRRLRERALAELRAVAPAGHSFGRRG
jgi:error-prone DNA polymerase